MMLVTSSVAFVVILIDLHLLSGRALVVPVNHYQRVVRQTVVPALIFISICGGRHQK